MYLLQSQMLYVHIGKECDRPRLTKITVSTVEEKSSTLHNCQNLRNKAHPSHVQKVFIMPDLTSSQQKRNKQLREELTELDKSGNKYQIKNGKITIRGGCSPAKVITKCNEGNTLKLSCDYTERSLSLNCYSITSVSKCNQLAALIDLYDIDIVLGTESDINQSFLSSEILPKSYKLLRKDRCLGGGGVFIAYKQYLQILEEPTLMMENEI